MNGGYLLSDFLKFTFPIFILSYRYPPANSSPPSTPVHPRRSITTAITISPSSSEASGASDDAPYAMEDADDEGQDEEALVRDFDQDGAQGAESLLGFDNDGLEDDAEEEEWNLVDDGELMRPSFVCPLLIESMVPRSLQEISNKYSGCCCFAIRGKSSQGWH
jgi:hypothetical protein